MHLRRIVVVVLALVSLAGCGMFDRDDKDPKREEIERLIESDAHFTLFLDQEATAEQKKAVEARLRALPGVTAVDFQTREAAYADLKKRAEEANGELADLIEVENLPETYVVKMKDQAGVRGVRDTPTDDELKALPGVDQLVFTCTTFDECKEQYSRTPSPAAT